MTTPICTICLFFIPWIFCAQPQQKLTFYDRMAGPLPPGRKPWVAVMGWVTCKLGMFPKSWKGKKITLERQHLNQWTSLCPYDYIPRLNNTVPNTKQQTLLHCSSQHERNIHYIQFATNNTKVYMYKYFSKLLVQTKHPYRKQNINFMKKN